jgi:hypothetical protein
MVVVVVMAREVVMGIMITIVACDRENANLGL